MKYLFLLAFLPFLAFSQYDSFDDVIEMEPMPDLSPLKSSFHKNIFGPKQRYDCLNEVMEYGYSFLSEDVNFLTSKAEDLYYEGSEPNEYSQKLDLQFLVKHIYTKKQIDKEIDDFINKNNINKEWLQSIEKHNLIHEVLSRGEKYEIKTSLNDLYLYNSYEGRTFMYVYHFNNTNQLVFNAYGYYVEGKKDTALWKQMHYEYRNNELIIKKDELYDDSNYRRTYTNDGSIVLTDLEVSQYKNALLIEAVKTKFKNKVVQYTEKKEYSYNKKNELVEEKIIVLNVNNSIHRTLTSTFKNNKLQKLETIIFNKDGEVYSKSEQINIFDNDENLQKLTFELVDKDGKVQQKYTKEYEYYPNLLVLNYKDEVFRYNRANLPLMYKYSFNFYKD